jgi:beta-D-xylosidase 4
MWWKRATNAWWLLLVVVLFQFQVPQPFALASPLWNDVCTQHDITQLPFCNVTLDLSKRVEDYQRRIPVEHQIQMMGNTAAGYPPLFIPPYQWWSEGLHGAMEPCVVVDVTTHNSDKDKNGTTTTTTTTVCACPTSFPCPSALGTAFNTTLWKLIGQAIGTEGRAISNLRPHNEQTIGDGLTYWSPNSNLQRDPRWGRNQEGTYYSIKRKK